MAITLGSLLKKIKPLLYDPNIVHFSDDFENIDSWTQAETGGLYSVSNSILSITSNTDGHITFYTTSDVVKDFVAIYVRFKIKTPDTSGTKTPIVELVGLCDTLPSDYTLHMNAKYNSSTNKFDVYVYKGGSTALSLLQNISIDVDTWVEVLLIYVEGNFEGFIKREGIDNDWQPVFQYYDESLAQYMLKVWIGAHYGGAIDYDKIIIYESAGTGLKDPRPIFDWSNGRYDPKSILRTQDGYMLWFATESYYGGGSGRRDRIIILKVSDDLTDISIYKHLTINQPGYTGQGILFKWSDNKIHGFLMNWREYNPPYQNGLHRILKVEMDENFENITINENITLNNAPDGGTMGHYDIWLVWIGGSWYAVTASFTGGVNVWSIDNPLSTTLTFYKQIFGAENKENVTIYPVTGNKLLLSIWDKGNDEVAIYRLSLDFVVEAKELSKTPNISGMNGGLTFILYPSKRFIVVEHGLYPYSLLQHDAGYDPEIYQMDTDYEYAITTVQVSKKKSGFPWWILLLIGIGTVMYLSGREKKK